ISDRPSVVAPMSRPIAATTLFQDASTASAKPPPPNLCKRPGNRRGEARAYARAPSIASVEVGSVSDCVAPGAFGLFGDDRVGAGREERRHRALIVGRVERAVGAGGQLRYLAHHPDLVVFLLGAGLVIVE